MWSIQPIRHWYQIGIVVLIEAVLGGWIGLHLKGVLLGLVFTELAHRSRGVSPSSRSRGSRQQAPPRELSPCFCFPALL